MTSPYVVAHTLDAAAIGTGGYSSPPASLPDDHQSRLLHLYQTLSYIFASSRKLPN